MKKLMFWVIVILVMFLGLAVVHEVSAREPTPMKWMHFFAANIHYLPEEPGLDHWQTPAETRELKTGDCEDLVILLVDFFLAHGYKNVCLITGEWVDGPGHAVIAINGVIYEPRTGRMMNPMPRYRIYRAWTKKQLKALLGEEGWKSDGN